MQGEWAMKKCKAITFSFDDGIQLSESKQGSTTIESPKMRSGKFTKTMRLQRIR